MADGASSTASSKPLLCVVGFHHARGPEIESWYGNNAPSIDDHPTHQDDWSLLPFMALADGAHSATEDFSYFTLRDRSTTPPRSLFGISCTRQIDANDLLVKPPDVTRSTVQKAIVVLDDRPAGFAMVRERLSVVTRAWFAQRDFTDTEILQRFHESLCETPADLEGDRDTFFGMSLRELIHKYKYLTLTLLKCALLQPKMLFYGSHSEAVCMIQFALISLIPGLIRKLQDCADPSFNSNAENLVTPSSLRTSDRSSLLTYMGLPLQLFGKGSLFGPYTPLQQLDILADQGTKSYIVGSTNLLLIQQKDRYCDIMINVDDSTVNVTSASLRSALTLSAADRRWIDFLTQAVSDTWNEDDPSRPKNMGYTGSEEFIRLQFDEYLLALLSSIRYRMFVETNKSDPKALLSEVDGDPATDFGNEWIEAWMKTENFRLFSTYTDSHLFDIVEPRHPTAGGLTVEDVQRRVAQQVSELHLDERWATGREALNKSLAEGRTKVSSAMTTLWADIEAMREAQRKRNEATRASQASSRDSSPARNRAESGGAAGGGKAWSDWRNSRAPDMAAAQASVAAASQRAGAYISSWGAWASEKRKTGWGRSGSPSPAPRDRIPSGGTTSFSQPASSSNMPKPLLLGTGATSANRPATTTVAELGAAATAGSNPSAMPRATRKSSYDAAQQSQAQQATRGRERTLKSPWSATFSEDSNRTPTAARGNIGGSEGGRTPTTATNAGAAKTPMTATRASALTSPAAAKSPAPTTAGSEAIKTAPASTSTAAAAASEPTPATPGKTEHGSEHDESDGDGGISVDLNA